MKAIKAEFGRPAARAVRAYQVAVTELAFVMTRIGHPGHGGLAGPHAETWQADVLAEVAQTRAGLVALTAVGRDPQSR